MSDAVLIASLTGGEGGALLFFGIGNALAARKGSWLTFQPRRMELLVGFYSRAKLGDEIGSTGDSSVDSRQRFLCWLTGSALRLARFSFEACWVQRGKPAELRQAEKLG